MKQYTSWVGIPAGTKFTVLKNNNGHNYPLHKTLTLRRLGDGGIVMNNCALEVPSGNSLNFMDCQFHLEMTLSELREEREALIKQQKIALDEIEANIKFCEDNEITKFFPNMVEVARTLEALESKKNNVQKAEAILELLRS